MKHTEGKKKNKAGKVLLIILCSILILALLAVVIVGVFMGRLLNLINRVDGTESTLSSSALEEMLNNQPTDESIYDEAMDPTDITWDTEPELIDNGPNVINILLIGSDTRIPGVRALSDTMVLCTLNKSQKTLTLTSFMRDMYVQIPGADPNRINTAYAIGGMDRLNRTLERNFGVKVDGNFAVEFDSFMDIIDLVGGVTINLDKSEAAYMTRVSDPLLNLSRIYVEGENQLTGSEALFYSRIRYIDSDFGRTQRQRNVLSAIFDKCKNLSVAQLYKLMEQVLPMLTTNMDNATILSYAAQAAPLLSGLTLQTQRIPVDHSYKGAMIDGMAVLVPDLWMNQQAMKEILADETPE